MTCTRSKIANLAEWCPDLLRNDFYRFVIDREMRVSPIDPSGMEHIAAVLANGVDLETRVLYLVGEIDEDVLWRFIVSFRLLDSTKGPIRIVLSSSGGSEASGFAMYDLIRLARNRVTIDCYGAVQSIAVLVLQAGHERRMSPECRFMMHYGHASLGEQIDQRTMIAVGDEARKSNERYQTLVAERSGHTVEHIAALCNDEVHLSAEEAVELGFADSLIGKEPPLKKTKSPVVTIEIDASTIQKLNDRKAKHKAKRGGRR